VLGESGFVISVFEVAQEFSEAGVERPGCLSCELHAAGGAGNFGVLEGFSYGSCFSAAVGESGPEWFLQGGFAFVVVACGWAGWCAVPVVMQNLLYQVIFILSSVRRYVVVVQSIVKEAYRS